MSHIIQDGTGTRNKAKVDDTNRLQVRAISEPSSIEALDKGEQYIHHTAVMNITNSSFTSVAYFKNTGTRDIIIKLLEFSSEKSNESTGTVNPKQTLTFMFWKNSTGPNFSQNWFTNNADFGSANVLEAEHITVPSGAGGANGGAFTSLGSLVVHDLIQCGTTTRLPLEEIKLRPGNSVGIAIVPPAGNTDLDFHINMITYLKD